MKMIIKTFLVLLALVPLSIEAQDLTAKQIIEKADAVMKGTNSTKAVMKITTERPKWSRDMTIKSWSLGDDMSMMLVTDPPKDKGAAYLMKEKEVWNWVPSIDRTIKMPPSMMMQSWMGTDLTNDDLVQQSSIITDYNHTITGEKTIDGRTCYQIQLIPKEEAAVVWGKIISLIDKEEFFQLRVEYYDEDDDLVNVMTASDIQTMGGKRLPSRLEVIPMDKKGQKTIIQYISLEFNVAIDEDYFTVQNMKRLK